MLPYFNYIYKNDLINLTKIILRKHNFRKLPMLHIYYLLYMTHEV